MKQNRRTAILSLSHFLVDFSCAFVIFSSFYRTDSWQFGLLLYNFCAFALQLPMGILADYYGHSHNFAAFGCVMVAMGMVLPNYILAVIILGLGNSAFHVGGGCEVMQASPDRAAPLGVFVAPGAIGLYLGMLLGRKTTLFLYPAVVLLLTMGIICRVGTDKFLTKGYSCAYKMNHGSMAFVVGLFFVVVLRSLSGMLGSFSWKSGVLAFLAVACTAAGKALGGFTNDRFGMSISAAGSLTLSAVLFLFADHPVAGLIAIALFNMTMPMTLYALSHRFPQHCGTGFGFLTFALFLGFLPQCLGISFPGDSRIWLAGISVISLVIMIPIAGKRRNNG